MYSLQEDEKPHTGITCNTVSSYLLLNISLCVYHSSSNNNCLATVVATQIYAVSPDMAIASSNLIANELAALTQK